MLVRLLTVIFLCAASNAEADCPDKARYVRDDLRSLWSAVETYPSSGARDGIFTTWDYSKPFYDVIKRSARRVDRTKGVYQELQDRWNYTYRLARSYPWGNSYIFSQLGQVDSSVRSLGACYGRD